MLLQMSGGGHITGPPHPSARPHRTRTWLRAEPSKPTPHDLVAAPHLAPFGMEGAVICPLGVADGRLAWKGKQHNLELVPGERSRQHLPPDVFWSRVSMECRHWGRGRGPGPADTEAGTERRPGRGTAGQQPLGAPLARRLPEARPLRGPPAAPSPTCRSPAAVQDGHPGPQGGGGVGGSGGADARVTLRRQREPGHATRRGP